MKASSIAFVAARLLSGREDGAGRRDQARRALRGAVLSIGLSLVPLLVVMQVADGMIQGISARYVELGTYHAQAHAFGSGASLEAARDALRAAPGVRGAWIETQSVGVAFMAGRREGAAIRAVEQGFLDDPGTAAYLRLEAGSLELSGPNDALLGSALARRLGAAPGDIVNLITVRRRADGEPQPRVGIVRVRGIVSAGYRELDSQWIFIGAGQAARLLDPAGSRSFVGVKADDPFAEPEAAARAAEAALIEGGYAVYPWSRIERNLFESLSSTKAMLILIMAMTVAIAAVNVSSALTTLVLERSHEIAVLKSLGARPKDLARTFAFGGAVLGAAGGAVGSGLGLVAAYRINEILRAMESAANGARALWAFVGGGAYERAALLDPEYYLETIPSTLGLPEVAAVFGATVLLCVIAALLPARKAARLDPMEAFRRR